MRAKANRTQTKASRQISAKSFKAGRTMSKSTSTLIPQQSSIIFPQDSLRGQDEDRMTGRHDPYQRPPDTLYSALAMSTGCPSPLYPMSRRPNRYSPVNRANMIAHLTSVLDEAIELFDDDHIGLLSRSEGSIAAVGSPTRGHTNRPSQ
jgi:hypothetical protein